MRNLSYDKLPPDPLTLTVLKLDGSSSVYIAVSFMFDFYDICLCAFVFYSYLLYVKPFHFPGLYISSFVFVGIKVAKTETVSELMLALEAAFYHLPKKGPAKVSW